MIVPFKKGSTVSSSRSCNNLHTRATEQQKYHTEAVTAPEESRNNLNPEEKTKATNCCKLFSTSIPKSVLQVKFNNKEPYFLVWNQ